jgi:hypothetical protein
MFHIKSTNLIKFFLIRIVGREAQTRSTRHVGHFWPIVPAPGDCEDGKFGGRKKFTNLNTQNKNVFIVLYVCKTIMGKNVERIR